MGDHEPDPVESAITVLVDSAVAHAQRARALDELSQAADVRVRDALVHVAVSEARDEELAAKVGRLLAKRAWADGSTHDLPLHDFTGPAYLGFDAELTDLMSAP